jgi:hypothetical protein
MAAIITNKFRIHNAESYIEGFSEAAATNVYLFIGRPQPWTDDTSPPTPTDNSDTAFNAYDDMVALKRVTSSDVTHAVVRRDWTTGTVYDEYAHDYTSSNQSNSGASDLYSASFYVLTEDYNVYKCISNNGNSQSTTKPTGTSTGYITTADGYVWKYMYTISAADALKFLSTDFMPVKYVTSDPGAGQPYKEQWDTQQAATDGEIKHIVITNAGSGYSSAPTVTITGDGTGATATATVSAGAITAVTITNVGSGYTQASISITGGGGTSGAMKAIVSPKGGHSSNPVHELGGFYVMNNVRLEYNDGAGDFPVSNDYRRIGLVRDPYNFGTTTVATDTTRTATRSITFEVAGLTGTFVVDEEITGGTSSATAKVIDWDATTRTLRYYQDINTGFTAFQAAETITGGTSSASGTVNADNNPEIEPDSGDIMYIEHRRPINRASDQIEDIKLVIEF